MSNQARDAKNRSDRYSVVTDVLGGYPVSSHPVHYSKRRWVFIGAAISPLIVVLLGMFGFFLYFLLSVDSFKELLDLFISTYHWISRMKVVLVSLVVFAIGFGVCGLLTVLASRYPTMGARDRISRAGVWSWGVVLAAVVLIGATGIIIVLKVDSTRLSLFAHALLLGPILMAIFVLGPLLDWVHGRGQRGYAVFLWVIGLIVAATVTMFTMEWVRTFSEWLAGMISDEQWKLAVDSEFGPHLPTDKDALPGAIVNFVRSVVMIINMCLLAVWLFWRHPIDEDAKSKAEEKEKKRGFFSRVIHAAGSVVASVLGLSEDKESDGPAPQDWLEPLLAADPLPEGCLSIQERSDEERGVKEVEYSPPCEDSEYQPFFGDITPSCDQDDALRKFLDGKVRDFARLIEGGSGGTGDLMVCGAPGAGRHTWLAATSLACAVLRGDKTLVLCPDEATADATSKQINSAMADSQVEGLIMIQRLNRKLEASLDAGKFASIPEVMVATPQEVEKAFFAEVRGGIEAKRAAIRMIDAIFVTDIMEFSADDSLQLPFLLGKIRLVNEVARDGVQVAVLVPAELDESMRAMIGDRLISPIRAWRGSRVVQLRPWRSPADVELLVEVDDVDAAFNSIAGFLLQRGQYVVVVRKGLGERALQKVRETLLPEGIPEDHLQVVPSLNVLRQTASEEAESDGPSHDWCIIMNRATREEGVGSMSVPVLPGAAHTAVIHLGRPDVMNRSRSVRLPLLGSSKSEGRLVRELATAIPYLEQKAPVHRNIWRQFGVPEAGRLRETEAGEREVTSFRFLVDPPEPAEGQPQPARGLQVFSWIHLDHYEGHHAMIGEVRAQGAVHALRLRSGSGSDLVITTQSLSGAEQKRIAEWSIEGQQFADSTSDLAKVDSLTKRAEGGRWFPRSIVDDGRGGVRIEGYRASDSPTEADKPMWSGQIIIPDDAVPVPATQGFPSCIRWYHLREDKSRSRSSFAQVTWSLEGYYAESGAASRIEPIEFQYEARPAMLVLGDWPGQDQPVEAPAGLWQIDDDGDRQYWPELTAAIMSGLCECMQHAGQLGRVMAFRSRSRPEVSQVLIAELPDLSGTLEELFRLIFLSETLQKQFVTEVRRVLQQSQRYGSDSRVCFQELAGSARQSMGSFNHVLDPTAALALFESFELKSASEDDISLV